MSIHLTVSHEKILVEKTTFLRNGFLGFPTITLFGFTYLRLDSLVE